MNVNPLLAPKFAFVFFLLCHAFTNQLKQLTVLANKGLVFNEN